MISLKTGISPKNSYKKEFGIVTDVSAYMNLSF